MPFLDLLYLNDSNQESTVSIRVNSFEELPGSVSVDGITLHPHLTFMAKENEVISVCGIPDINAPGVENVCCSLDFYLNEKDTDIDDSDDSEIPRSPCSISSKGSEQTDCSVETPSTIHSVTSLEKQEYLKKLAETMDSYGACITAYRSYTAEDMFRFDFQGTPRIVCGSIILFRKVARELAESYDFSPCFDISDNYDLPWCKLTFQIIHSGFGDETTVKNRMIQSHSDIQKKYEYMYEETALTDITIVNGVVIDSRYLASENPWKSLYEILTSMAEPPAVEQAESKTSE
jgi:hypothetical protein